MSLLNVYDVLVEHATTTAITKIRKRMPFSFITLVVFGLSTFGVSQLFKCHQLVCFCQASNLAIFVSNMGIETVNVAQKLSLFSEHWNPKIVGELNGQHVKLAKLYGEFVWHKHDEEDELFWVVSGVLKIELRDKMLVLNAGEFVIIPKEVEHKPIAEHEVEVMLFEPASTINTGNASDTRKRETLERI